MSCNCEGREHIVCRTWRVPTAKNPLAPRGLTCTLKAALAEGLVVLPEHPVWTARRNGRRNGQGHEGRECPTCKRTNQVVIRSQCLGCAQREVDATPERRTAGPEGT